MAKYRVIRGMNFPDGSGGEARVEPGDTIDDASFTKKEIDALVVKGTIEKAGSTRSKPTGGDE